MCNPAAEETINRLTPTLRRAAYCIAQRDPSGLIDTDDVFQGMIVEILERAARDPGFLDQKPAYVCIAACHGGGTHKVRNSRMHYSHKIDPLHSGEKAFDELDDALDRLPGPDPSPEQEVIDIEQIQAISAAVMALTPENQRVVKMLYHVYAQKEIAVSMGISQPAVTQRKQTIKEKITMHISIKATLERLAYKLRHVAYRIAQNDPSGLLDAGAAYHKMVAVLQEGAEKEPDLLSREDIHILLFCAFGGGDHQVRHTRLNCHSHRINCWSSHEPKEAN